MRIFEYGATELKALSRCDCKMAKFIACTPHIEREMDESLFSSLAHQIIGQQISNKALATIWLKVRTRFPDFVPEKVLSEGGEVLKACGTSGIKARYILGVAKSFIDGTINPAVIDKLSDSDTLLALTAIKGVGTWTGQMVMLFGLGRRDVFSFSDLALKKGLAILHGEKETTPQMFEHYRALYSPFGSTASLYLWEAAAKAKDFWEGF